MVKAGLIKVEGQLSLGKMPRNRSQQVSVGKSVNPTGDEGGHLIASIIWWSWR